MTALSAVSILSFREPVLRFFPGTLLVFFLPGFLLTRLIFKRGEVNHIEEIILSFALSLPFSTIAFLIANYCLPKVTTGAFVLILFVTNLAFLFLNLLRKRNGNGVRVVSWNSVGIVLFLVLLSTFLRFPHLGYSDYQGDETHGCLSNAMAILSGDTEALMTQKKGPTQIIIPAISHLIFNSYNEFIMRFPFALAGLFGVIVVFLIGRNLFNPFVGIASGVLVAINGYFIAFSRLVQYQSFVFFYVSLTVLFLSNFIHPTNPKTERKSFLIGIFFFSFSILSHYDGLILLPFVFYVIFEKYRSRSFEGSMKVLGYSAIIFILVISIFYVPFILHPNFAQTFQNYKQGRLGSGLHFNYEDLLYAGSLYNSPAYMAFLIFFSLLAFLLKMNLSFRLVLAWFIPYFVFFMIVFEKPNTHILNFFPPWCILTAMGLYGIYELKIKFLQQPNRKILFKSILVSIFFTVVTITGLYVFRVFIKHTPEFLWLHPHEKLPHFGLFGFPYHRGWKTVGYLFRTKVFNGTYTSNEKDRITNFYLRQKQVSPKQSRYMIVADKPQSWRNIKVPRHFAPSARILSDGETRITIYEDAKTIKELKIYHSEEYDKLYDELDRKKRVL